MMKKLWAKIIIDYKVVRSLVIEIDDEKFDSELIRICEGLQIPTPIITACQKQSFFEYNILKLKQRDFVETIHFDILEFNVIID